MNTRLTKNMLTKSMRVPLLALGLVTATADEAGRTWDLRSRKEVFTVESPGGTEDLAWSADGSVKVRSDLCDGSSTTSIRGGVSNRETV